MKRGIGSDQSQHRIANLTHYNMCFNIFDPEYDVLNKMSSIDRAKNAYQKTNEFVLLLESKSQTFLELAGIALTLREINNYFAQALMIESKGIFNIVGEALTLAEAKEKIRFHFLADDRIKNMDAFLQSISACVDDMVKTHSQQIFLDSNAKLDDVDNQLLQSASIELPMDGKFFDGTKNINVKTERSNLSLFANGNFHNAENKVPKEERQIIKILNKFVLTVTANGNQLGVNPPVAITTTTTIADEDTRQTKRLRM